MERSLRKGSCGMHVSYAPGGGMFSNNLRGKNFAYHDLGGMPYLKIDMSGNLHVRNKRADCHSDALACVENHEALNHIELEKEIVSDFARLAKVPPAQWHLELDFAEKGCFLYSVVNWADDEINVSFDVKFSGTFKRPSAEEMAMFNRLF